MKTAFLFCNLLLIFPLLHAQHKQQRPNIVIFVADDLGYHDTGPYGNKVVKTPHLNRFAANALLFTNAFANTPTCIPSRTTLLTGIMPQRNGSHANNVKGYPVSEVSAGVQTLPVYLRQAGYRVALAGKRHIFPLKAFPFEWIAQSEVREPGYENKPGLFTDLNTGAVDAWLAQQDGSQPFCLVVADNSPHVIWPERSIYPAAAVDVPPNAVASEEYRRMRGRYYTDVTKMDTNFGKVLNSLQQYGLTGQTLVIFTSDQGAQFPFAKWNLYDAGVRVPLLVQWPGKVASGRTNAMVAHIDLLPTLLAVAGAQAATGLDGKSYADVLLGKKQQHRQEVFLTHSQDGLMNITPMRGVRTGQYKYILNLSPQYEYHTHIDAARDHDGGASYWIAWEQLAEKDSGAARLIRRYHVRPKEELYDVVKDPYELHNLAGEQQYGGTLRQLREKLAAFRQQQKDTITGPILDIEPSWKSERAAK
jgi:uncharacterized sulfatase